MAAKKKVYTIPQAAKKLRITKTAVYDAIKDGRLRATEGKVTVSALVISATDLRKYRVDVSRQERGKKN
jgi:hypothetical protein